MRQAGDRAADHVAPSPVLVDGLGRVARELWIRLVLERVLLALPWGAAIALVPSLLLGLLPLVLPKADQPAWTGWPWPPALWCGVLIVMVLAGTWRRLFTPVSLGEAAAWLDRRLDSRELFSAALAAGQRSPGGPFDDELRFQAEARLSSLAGSTGGLFPVRALRRQAVRAALAVLPALMLAVVVPGLASGFTADGGADGAALPELAGQVRGQPRPAPDPAEQEARRLFPEDERLARLAVPAIAAGDQAALDYLLGQAHRAGQAAGVDGPAEPGSGDGAGQTADGQEAGRPDGAGGLPGPGAPRSAERSRKSPGGVPGSPNPQPGGPSPRGGTGNPGNGGNDGPGGPGGRGLDGKGHPGGRSGQGPGEDGSGNRGGDDRDCAGKPGAEGSTGHARAGSGMAGDTVDGAPAGASPGPRVLFGTKPQGGRFEMVLPGSDSRLPLAQVLPAARSASEAVFGRESTPLSYENYIRSYFRALSQEVDQ